MRFTEGQSADAQSDFRIDWNIPYKIDLDVVIDHLVLHARLPYGYHALTRIGKWQIHFIHFIDPIIMIDSNVHFVTKSRAFVYISDTEHLVSKCFFYVTHFQGCPTDCSLQVPTWRSRLCYIHARTRMLFVRPAPSDPRFSMKDPSLVQVASYTM